MGVCLRANMDGTLVTSKHGAMFNLHMYLNVMTYEDFYSVSMSSGVKVNNYHIGILCLITYDCIVYTSSCCRVHLTNCNSDMY
jgi:hypothetical protein